MREGTPEERELRLDERLVQLAAAAAHGANRMYCESLGDFTQPSWERASKEHRDSVLDGVRYAARHPDATPEDSHANWLKLKESEGWKYGPVKDPERKEHPCMVSYEQLLQEHKLKDSLFLAVARAVYFGAVRE